MNGFKPVKKPNSFNYKPRFYDPNKEVRDLRRSELRGTSSESDGTEYEPGSYIRRSAAARNERRGEGKKSKSSSMWFLIIGVTLIFLLSYSLAPRLVELFLGAGSGQTSSPATESFEEFDPYAPIRIVPNDYNGEE